MLAGLIAMPVSAESAASKVDTYCTVNSQGDCLVNMTVTLRLEALSAGMSFPLPASATNITLNGSAVQTTKTDSAIQVDISRVVSGITGEIPLNFNFTLPEAVQVQKNLW